MDAMRILIVENNAEFRALLKSVLLQRIPNGVIHEAADAKGALQLFRSAAPDIVLTDIRLSGPTNGLALTARIRRQGPTPPIVIITNHNLPEYRAAAERLGANHFFAKSTSSPDEIVAVVYQLVHPGAPS
jgi:DNA-binding NarL/FixJ family response regulator